MAFSTSVLIDTLLQTEITPNELLAHFDAIIMLLKKYGKAVYTPKMMTIIKVTDTSIYWLIKLLIHYKKQNIADIKSIAKYIQQKSPNYISTFTVQVPKEQCVPPIQDFITKKFPNSQIQKQSNIDLWISVSWSWWHYKRNIDQDIQKLLW